MNSTVIKLGRSLFFSVAPMREKALAVFVVLCIFVNALVPKFSIDAKDYSTLCRIMKSQTVLFEFFSLSNLPVKIVNELFTERGGVSPLARKKAPKDDTSNTSNTSSDFSITGSGLRDVSARYSAQRGFDLNGSGAALLCKYLNALPEAHSSAPPGMCFSLMIVLMFFFLRARSALPDAAAIFSFATNRAQFRKMNWVFSLYITILPRSPL